MDGRDGAAGSGADHGLPVDGDPFWSVVRRRHPDVDVVVLPPVDGARPQVPEGAVPVAADEAGLAADAEARRLGELLLDDGDLESDARWTHGRASGTVRRETTVTRAGVDEVAAVGAVVRGETRLTAEGWHAFAPADGLPRVMAGREPAAGVGREEVQLVAPGDGRLVLRVRSGEVLVGESVATALVAGGVS